MALNLIETKSELIYRGILSHGNVEQHMTQIFVSLSQERIWLQLISPIWRLEKGLHISFSSISHIIHKALFHTQHDHTSLAAKWQHIKLQKIVKIATMELFQDLQYHLMVWMTQEALDTEQEELTLLAYAMPWLLPNCFTHAPSTQDLHHNDFLFLTNQEPKQEIEQINRRIR